MRNFRAVRRKAPEQKSSKSPSMRVASLFSFRTSARRLNTVTWCVARPVDMRPTNATFRFAASCNSFENCSLSFNCLACWVDFSCSASALWRWTFNLACTRKLCLSRACVAVAKESWNQPTCRDIIARTDFKSAPRVAACCDSTRLQAPLKVASWIWRVVITSCCCLRMLLSRPSCFSTRMRAAMHTSYLDVKSVNWSISP